MSDLQFDVCYGAVQSRDARFDGRFTTGVLSTGIFCRPSCPARTPRRDRVRFFPTPAAALAEGFRACRRCRPELAPDVADPGVELATRALRMIEDGEGDDGTAALATRLHVSERHLSRVLSARFGAGPGALARMRRARVARMLVDQTDLPLAQVAFSAGFGSIRQFNDTFRTVYGVRPSDVRRGLRATGQDLASGVLDGNGRAATLHLAVPQPFDPTWVLRWLELHGVPGADRVDVDGAGQADEPGGGPTGWRRSGEDGLLVRPTADGLAVTPLDDAADIRRVIGRVRQVFDTDADISAITSALSADPLLQPIIDAAPGLRIPGSPDPWEGPVRTILGQQVSSAAAATLMGRLADLHDGVGIPGPEVLCDLDLGPPIGLPWTRAAAIRALAAAVREGLDLRPGADPEVAGVHLRSLPGIGPWTAQTIRLLTLRDPDAWPSGDIALRNAVGQLRGDRPSSRELDRMAERWRPWRGYAALWLWHVVLHPEAHLSLEPTP